MPSRPAPECVETRGNPQVDGPTDASWEHCHARVVHATGVVFRYRAVTLGGRFGPLSSGFLEAEDRPRELVIAQVRPHPAQRRDDVEQRRGRSQVDPAGHDAAVLATQADLRGEPLLPRAGTQLSSTDSGIAVSVPGSTGRAASSRMRSRNLSVAPCTAVTDTRRGPSLRTTTK